MNRSISTRNMRQFSKSPSKRGLYINTQLNKREKHTTFHSPYKDGKPNKDYINPSFISSHLFYPKEYLQNHHIVVQQNYVQNTNDIKKQTLYQQRIKTQIDLSVRDLSPKNQEKQYFYGRNANNKVFREKSPEKQLVKELKNLYDYRQNAQQIKKQRNKQEFREMEQVPIYLQKLRRDNSYEINKQTHRQREMREWIQLTTELKQIKKEMQQTNRTIENQRFNRQIQEGRIQSQQQQRQKRKQSQILANILRQQIRYDRQKRIKNL